MKVTGNTEGIRNAMLEEMAQLFDCGAPADEFASVELIGKMADYTARINREILAYIARNGNIVSVVIGDSNTVSMEELRLVRNRNRLNGIRCIHTHPGGDGRLSSVDRGSLAFMKLDAMAAIGVSESGEPRNIYVGILLADGVGNLRVEEIGPLNPNRIPSRMLLEMISETDRELASVSSESTGHERQKAVICGIGTDLRYDSLSELEALAETAGITVVERTEQKKQGADPVTYVGSGKAEELRLTCSAVEADAVIFDDELTAIQMRNLEQIIGLPIMDRTMLILDIFAQRAQSREGRLQVELAQLKYRMPRLMGMGNILSRQGASGVGMRGPGEKKLEIDRRRIKRRIFELQQELNEIEKQRAIRRTKREKNNIPVVALVGYTNAGKSTLLNLLSESDVLAEDMLFATLDPVVRKIAFPDGTECLLSDTVGFINKLPHELINAFRSTLEEVRNADVILHVIDVASGFMDVQTEVVEDTLEAIGAGDIPCIRIYNKMDLLGDMPLPNDGVLISAKTGQGSDELLDCLESELTKKLVTVELTVPYDRYDLVSVIRQKASILSESHEDNGTRFRIMIDERDVWMLKQ